MAGEKDRVMERVSEEEVKRIMMKRYRSRNIRVGLGLAAGVFGIYAYSMYAVKQDSHLDEEFDKPLTSSEQKPVQKN